MQPENEFRLVFKPHLAAYEQDIKNKNKNSCVTHLFFLSFIFLTNQTMSILSLTLSPTSLVRVSNTKPHSSSNNIQCYYIKPSDSFNCLADCQENKTHINSDTKVSPPPRPRRIILVRHGQSEGNLDESVYTSVADPKIALTNKGLAEAEECGKRIREVIEKDGAIDWKVYFYASPYRRTLETLRSLGLAFERDRVAGMREEPRLREQDFGMLH